MNYTDKSTNFLDSDNESCDTVPCNEIDNEYSFYDHVVIEKEEARRYKEAEDLSVPTGVFPRSDGAEKDADEEGKGDEEACEEEGVEVRLPTVGEENEEEEDEYDAYYDAEQYEDESLIPNDMSTYSEMSIDMEVYGDIDGIAAVEVMQVDGSGCGWYPTVNEDIEMKNAPFIDVEMLDADEGDDAQGALYFYGVTSQGKFIERGFDTEMEQTSNPRMIALVSTDTTSARSCPIYTSVRCITSRSFH
ncbi:unnamed protein product [Mucor circinelloides]